MKIDGEIIVPTQLILVKPKGEDGLPRDQTGDAAQHMRHAAAFSFGRLKIEQAKDQDQSCVIVGGAPSIKDHLNQIQELAANPKNAIFALNFTHNWLVQNGIIPTACVFFEIDAEPPEILAALRDDVTYYVCSHCHETTFDALRNKKVVVWHSTPNSEAEKEVGIELFQGDVQLGGGISTFLRSLSVALALGYRKFDLFGVDSSFPDDSETTHVKGYQTLMTLSDAFYIYTTDKLDKDEPVRRFKTVSYLAVQVEEFKHFCRTNHGFFKMQVHGPGLLPYVHRKMWSFNYE